MNLEADGSKRVELNLGVAEQESLRKRSEGKRDAQIEMASAESRSLEILGTIMNKENCSQSEYMISQKYLELIREMGSRTKEKTIYLPYQISKIDGIIKDLPVKFGLNGKGGGVDTPRKRIVMKSSRGSRGDFDDLS